MKFSIQNYSVKKIQSLEDLIRIVWWNACVNLDVYEGVDGFIKESKIKLIKEK